MPPEWLWPFDEELDSWFSEVERRRKEKYGAGAGGDDGPIEGPTMDNEYAAGMR